MITLCTLFDHNYLDKGLAMYESLDRVCDEFELYVLAMSDKCYQILTELHYAHLKPIKLSDFEDEELLRVKPNRKVGEYCWTCSSSLIRYILQTFKPEYCTYIDADMFFYSNPKVIIDEMQQKNASVQVVGHRFSKSEKAKYEWKVGKYCVEFNTFKNDKNGLELLETWRNQCLEYCSADGDGVHFGDQKYLDNWCDDYPFCIETEQFGAGVGPWNIAQYRYVSGTSDNNLTVQCGKKTYPMIFYHFENIAYLEKKAARINVNAFLTWGLDNNLVSELYTYYLQSVDKQKDMLKERFDLDILIKSHPGRDFGKQNFWQKLCSFVQSEDFKKNLANIIYSKIFKVTDTVKF